MKFKEYKGLDLAGIAAEVLAEWDARDTFRKSVTTREGHPTFVFYEGPPSANGMPGIHHVMARTIKDVFCRYKTQQGYLVHRKAGWDTHGLPVELGVEKKLGITKEDIGRTISIEQYNRTCREAVMEFTGVWEELTRKMGYWVDMQHPYVTYDNKYIETLWWLLKQLFDKGLLYKGYTIQPYSPAAGTGLSTHELNQPGCYRDVKDTTVVAQFRILSPKAEMEGWAPPRFWRGPPRRGRSPRTRRCAWVRRSTTRPCAPTTPTQARRPRSWWPRRCSTPTSTRRPRGSRSTPTSRETNWCPTRWWAATRARSSWA